MSASSSNRNFIGRQGSPTGRTLLMSPAMVAAAAITGAVADVREIFDEHDSRLQEAADLRRGIPLPGNDIDTDRIIPAALPEGSDLPDHGRARLRGREEAEPRASVQLSGVQGASVLVVGQNFGCGSRASTRRKALMRWGIAAIVGGSYGEISSATA